MSPRPASRPRQPGVTGPRIAEAGRPWYVCPANATPTRSTVPAHRARPVWRRRCSGALAGVLAVAFLLVCLGGALRGWPGLSASVCCCLGTVLIPALAYTFADRPDLDQNPDGNG